VFKSSIAKILIIVLVLKIMLSVDLDDLFSQYFSVFLSTLPQTPSTHMRTLRVTPVENRLLGW
jgi:hypothetical protein